MKYFLPILLCTLSYISLHAQVDPLYAQYLNNPVLINPAYTGLNNNFSAAVSYRRQWSGFIGNPVTVNANCHMSLLNNKLGVGFILLSDKVGNNVNTEAYSTYAYKLQMKDGVFSFGLQVGIINYRSDNGDLNPYDASDPAFNSNLNITKFSLGGGIIYKTERLFLGLSVPRMLRQQNIYDNIVTDLYSQHLYANAAYTFFLSERVRFKPSLLLKEVHGSPLSIDYNLLFNLDEKYTAGIYTRNLNTYGALFQIKLGDSYQVGYSFEMPSNKSIGAQYTTHEFCLSLNIPVLSFHEASIKSF